MNQWLADNLAGVCTPKLHLAARVSGFVVTDPLDELTPCCEDLPIRRDGNDGHATDPVLWRRMLEFWSSRLSRGNIPKLTRRAHAGDEDRFAVRRKCRRPGDFAERRAKRTRRRR